MKYSLLVLTMMISFIASSAYAAEPLLKLPNGYQEGRDDAKYGTYSSVVSDSARGLQARLANLENKIMGVSHLSREDKVRLSESLFTLEFAALKLHLDIANAPDNVMTKFERASMLFSSVRMYLSLRFQGERLFEDMVRYIDVKIPGPNGLQFREEIADTLESLHYPNYRSDDPLTPAQRHEMYGKKVKEFEAKGGSLTEIKLLTPELLKQMKHYTRVEYVVRANDEIYVTEGGAGHVLLAAGGAAKAAGQMIFMKNEKGEFTMLVVSNSSGNFKPDILTAGHLGERLRRMLSIGAERVVVTKGEPLSTQAVKVYSKGLGVSKDIVKERLARLEQMEARLKASPGASYANRCLDLFAKLKK